MTDDTDARDTERKLDRVISNGGSTVAAVSVTTWDDRGEEFIEAVEEAMQEVYDV